MPTLKKVKTYDVCIRCGARFTVYRMKQKFCNVACRVAHHRDAKRNSLEQKLARLNFLESMVGPIDPSFAGQTAAGVGVATMNAAAASASIDDAMMTNLSLISPPSSQRLTVTPDEDFPSELNVSE